MNLITRSLRPRSSAGRKKGGGGQAGQKERSPETTAKGRKRKCGPRGEQNSCLNTPDARSVRIDGDAAGPSAADPRLRKMTGREKPRAQLHQRIDKATIAQSRYRSPVAKPPRQTKRAKSLHVPQRTPLPREIPFQPRVACSLRPLPVLCKRRSQRQRLPGTACMTVESIPLAGTHVRRDTSVWRQDLKKKQAGGRPYPNKGESSCNRTVGT